MQTKARAAICVAAVAGAATAASGQDGRVLHVSPVPEMIAPTRYAPIILVDGQARIAGDWRDYEPNRSRPSDCFLLWDAVQVDPCTGLLIGGTECGLGEGSRWYWGTYYVNPFSANDMSMDPGYEGSFATRAGWLWWWGKPSPCYIGILTSHQFISLECDWPVTTSAGWFFDFGVVAKGFWLANVDLGSGGNDGWDMPASGDGSNLYILADAFDGVDFDLALFNCHFGLWGTGDDGGIPNRPGTNDDQQHDDAYPTDGIHTMPDECYYYYSECPDPLCNAMAFWGRLAPDTCYVDCNGDTIINSLDVLCFLNLFTSGDPDADCNGDTTLDSRDLLCFLNLYANPPCP